jgi:hypothetical protein
MSEFYDEYTDDEVDLVDEIELTKMEIKLNSILEKYNINIESVKNFIEKRCYDDNTENNISSNNEINYINN